MRNIWYTDEKMIAIMSAIKACTVINYILKSYNLQQRSRSNDGKPGNSRNY